MADSVVDPEIGEQQVTSATAVELPRASSEAHEVVKFWADHNHRVDYAEEPPARPRIRDRDYPLKYADNGNGVAENHYTQDDEKWSEQEESFSKNEIHTADRFNGDVNDCKMIVCKKDNDSFRNPKDKLEITCATPLNDEAGRNNKIFSKCNHVNAIVVDNNETRAADHGIKMFAIASTNKRINNSSESAYSPQNVDKISSGKCKCVRDIEGHKNDCNDVDAEPMEISSSQNRARSHGDDIVVFNTASRIGALRDETTCKVVHSSAKASHARSSGKACRSTRNALGNRKEPWDQETDIAVPCAEQKERGAARKYENCGDSHFSYGRYSQLWKYSDYLNRGAVAVYEAANRDAARIAANNRNRETDSTRLAAPIATAVLYRSRSLPRLSMHDSGVACSDHTPVAPEQVHAASRQLVADLKQLLTLKQHYYPEGGWGWVILLVGLLVQILSHGAHEAVGVFIQQVTVKFGPHVYLQAGWLGAMSTSVALLVSPVTIAFCRRKSTRVTAVLGGLVTALGCLFTSFASQFHQLFFSYGTVVGIGVGMTRDCSTLMVAQYFKRKRELVEIFIVSGSGLGIAVMSAFIKGAITKIGWRLGLQAVTGVVFLTFILGTFYRSASLYHPQRRAILHLKNQKRKIKDKNKVDDRPPFFDFSTLRSKTVRILLVSTGISAFGINTPIFYLAHQAEEEGLGDTVVLLQAYLGLAWTLGCVAFGLLVVHRSVECRIARQYLTQAAVFVCGLCILALTAVQGNYHGYVMFAWIYGIFCGGYHYSLKMYTYERVRARNFARTWGFVQCSQAIPIAIGVPISGYINVGCGGKAGYYFSSTCVLVGSFTLFFIDLHRRNLSKHKHTRANGTKHICASDSCPQRRRPSFSQEPENEGPHVAAAGAAGATAAALVLGADLTPAQGEPIDVLVADKPELTCISEEGIADMDLPDNLLEELDYIGDCITSCNKVENYLMLSEFENNLIAEMPIITDRRGRRWSVARSKTSHSNCGQASGMQSTTDEANTKPKWRFTNVPHNTNTRMITVIDEASA
ncbi:uncharacterized protein [Linepithema humile]|uniref:uncharacterized protein isoform X1 n=1 Tax=Linepithema humile TaxID=83485 RepID=UPI00351F6B0C